MITQIGSHKTKCGNLIDGIDDLMGSEKADVIYSDPPWGQGNLSYWETIRLRQTGATERRDNDLFKFLDMFFLSAQKYAKNVLLAEYGIKWREMFLGTAKGFGFQNNVTIRTLYKSGAKVLPMELHVLSKTPVNLPPGYVESVTDTQDMDTVKNAVKPFVAPGGILLDPCCGMGFSARTALHYGMVFRGNELNSSRLAKTNRVLENGAKS